MTSEEFEKLCEELRAQYSAVAKKEHPDASEDDIADMCDAAIMKELWDMFQDEKIEKDDLIKMAGQLGFEPNDEFVNGNSATVTGATQSIPTDDGEIKVDAEAIEEAQGYDDEDAERKEARKLYGFDDDEDEKEKEEE